MYDYRIVEQVSRKPKHMSGFLRKIMIIFAVFFVLLGIVISQAFMLAGFLLALLYFVYDVFSQRDYEYTMENGELTIDVIYGKKYRKTADVPYYTMIIKEDGHKIKLLLDLTEEMLHTMKTQFPEKVYFA